MLEKAKRMGTMTRAEERRQIRLAQKGDEDAMERLVVSNLLLAYSDVVIKYVGKGVDVEELIQEAATGIQKAILRFDLRKHKDKKLMTYAKWWVIAKVSAYCNSQCSTVRVHWQAAKDAVAAKTACINDGVPVTDQNMAERFDGNWETVGRPAFMATIAPASLDSPSVKDEDDSQSIVDSLVGDDAHDDGILSLMDAEKAAGLRYLLTVREMRVIEMRYGLDGREPRVLDDVGKAIGVTRERARQIQEEALAKLRRLAKERL